MRRTKEWWKNLSKEERCTLVGIERAEHHSYSGYNLPDYTTLCGYCSSPKMGYGVCPNCNKRALGIIVKAEELIQRLGGE